MILSGINFALHFRVLSRSSFFRILRGISARIKDRRSKRALFHTSTFADQSSFRQYLRDAELRTYLWVLLITTLTVAVVLVLAFDRYESTSVTIKHGLFQAVSIATTSGFTTTDFSSWPLFLPALLLAASIIGGCTGSTAGGVKVFRIILLFKQGRRQIPNLSLIHI